MKKTILLLFVFIIAPFSISIACDQTAASGTRAALETAIAAANVGETVCLPNGTYDDFSSQASPLLIDESGTSGNQIIVKPVNVGGVTFTGYFQAHITGSYITFRDFKFLNNDANGVTVKLIKIEGDYVVITNNDFTNLGVNDSTNQTGFGVSTFKDSGADDGEISHNTFNTWFNTIPILAHGYRTNIDHNYFTNTNNVASSKEGIQIGDENVTTRDYANVVEYNYFYQVRGDTENISNKSSSNVYRYNVFDSGESLTLRNGDDCIVDNNYFLNPAEGAALRIYEDDHIVINNYFIGGIAETAMINIPAGTEDPYVPDSGHESASNLLFANNTIIVTSPGNYGIIVGYNSDTWKPDNITFQNNYIQQGLGTLFRLYYGSIITYTTNTCNNEGSATYENGGDFCNDQETSSVLSLVGDLYRLTASQGDGTTLGDVTDDFDADTRANPPDTGADEWVNGVAVGYIQKTEVGFDSLVISNISPPDNATDVAIGASITWTNPTAATSVTVFFDSTDGTTQVATGSLDTSYDPGGMAVSTEYFWKVNVVHAGGTETGTVYSFTTASGPPTDPTKKATIGYDDGGGAIKYDSGGMTIQ